MTDVLYIEFHVITGLIIQNLMNMA